MLYWAKEQNEEKSPMLTQFTMHFNNVSQWWVYVHVHVHVAVFIKAMVKCSRDQDYSHLQWNFWTVDELGAGLLAISELY